MKFFFLKKKGIFYYLDDGFEEFAPATQDLRNNGKSLTPTSKVQAWLTKDNSVSTPPLTKKTRRKSVAAISKVILERSENSVNRTTSTASSEDISAELAKILAKEKDIINEEDPKESEESLQHEPYRPPSFQDYSSDSAKALFAKY